MLGVGERVVMMTSELWDAVGQSERVVAGTSVGAAGDLRVRQVFWREQGEPVLVDSCTWVWMFVLSNWSLGHHMSAGSQ